MIISKNMRTVYILHIDTYFIVSSLVRRDRKIFIIWDVENEFGRRGCTDKRAGRLAPGWRYGPSALRSGILRRLQECIFGVALARIQTWRHRFSSPIKILQLTHEHPSWCHPHNYIGWIAKRDTHLGQSVAAAAAELRRTELVEAKM